MSAPTPLQRIGNRYDLVAELGEGGMGTVYRAFDRLTGDYVALKRVLTPVENIVFNTRILNVGDLRLMLIKEFQVLASLRHPNIISVLDYGFDEEKQPYYTMEYLSNAQTIIDYGQARSSQTQIDLLAQLLRALAYLHRRGVLHRDIKPANVLVCRDQVKVLDFGLSQITGQKEQTGGTLNYMAPEVLAGDTALPASDLYAVGIIAYELFSGDYLYDVTSVGALVDNILFRVPDITALEVDSAVRDIITRLLAKNPYDRYADASAVIRALQSATGQRLPLETSASRDSFLNAAQFVGRDAELGRLSAALDEVMGDGSGPGRGAAFLIGGESGIGKSRLLSELRIKALLKGATVISGQAVKGSGLAYQAWQHVIQRLALSTPLDDLEASILRQIVPDIGTLLERPIPATPIISEFADRHHLILTIIDLFRRQQHPLVLIFEDAQWMYESLEPLQWLVDTIHTLPMLLLASYRSDVAPALPERLPEMELILLDRLQRQDIQALSVSMIGAAGHKPQLIDMLERETEGNALFLVEVVRMLAERAGGLDEIAVKTLPHIIFSGGLKEVIARRINHVPVEAHPLLRLAAVAGRWLDLRVLRVLAKKVDLEEWLTVCINSAVLDVLDGQYRFAHDKLRQAVLEKIDGGDVPDLHREVAEAIESAYLGDETQAPFLANLWHTAGDLERECQYAKIAGQKSFAVSRFADARAQFRRAYEIATTDSLRIVLARQLADVEERLGNYASAIAQYEAVVRRAATMRNDSQATHVRADAFIGLGVIANHQSRYALAQQFIRKGHALYEALGSKRGIASALLHLGLSAHRQGEFAAAKTQVTQALTLFREDDNIMGAANALHHLGSIVFAQGDHFTAHEYYRQSMMMWRSIGDRWGVAMTLNDLGNVASKMEDPYSAQQYFDESYQIRVEIGDRLGVADSQMSRAESSRALGRLIDAHDHYHQALTIRRSLGDRQGAIHTLVDLSSLLFELDDAANARRYLGEALRLARQLDNATLYLKVLLGVAYARLYVGLGIVAAAYLNFVVSHLNYPQSESAHVDRLRMKLEAALTPSEMGIGFNHSQSLTIEPILLDVEREFGSLANMDTDHVG